MRPVMLPNIFPVLLSLLSPCQAANIEGPWTIDFTTDKAHNCRAWTGEIRRAYDEAAVMAKAAMRDLNFIKSKRPDFNNNNRRDYENWDKIDRTLLNFYGFSRDPDEDGGDGEYWKKVQEVFKSMDDTLNGNDMHNNYEMPFQRAVIACGDEGWIYIKPEAVDPGDPDRGLLKDTKPKYKDTGAWYWNSRYLWIPGRTTTDAVNICRSAGLAVTVHAADMVVLCKGLLDPRKPVIDTSRVKENAELDALVGVMSFTMVHEFAHYFGCKGDPTEEDWLTSTRDRKLIDQQAVDENGVLQYIHPDPDDFFGFTDQPKNDAGQNNKPYLVYGYDFVQMFAVTHKDNTNCGPGKATDTAEAYAFFAAASHLSDWDWTPDGKAGRWFGTPS